MLSSLLVLLFLCDRIQTTTGFHIATWLKVRNGIVSWQQSCSHRIEITTYSMSSIHAQSTQFIVSRTGPVTPEEIANENLIRIVNLHATDLQCNELCWKCLGYVYDNVSHTYSSEHVFPKWKDTFPSPPDIIGMKRSYDVIIDKPVRDASMALMRSIPRDFKGGVRALEKEGFTGYKLSELTPNKTRRAQLVNWLIYYREKLFNKTIEQLRAEREAEIQQARTAANTISAKELNESSNDGVTGQLADLPSERNYQKHRLDQ